MVFASPIFLFLFLPLTLAAYFTLPRRFGNAVLLVASAAFYIWGEGIMLTLVLASVLFNWRLGHRIDGALETRARRRWLTLAIAGNLLLLGVFKYANFIVANFNAVAAAMGWGVITLATIPLPLGISFFSFHAISYLVDIYRRNAAPQRRVDSFALYIMLFVDVAAHPMPRQGR